MRTDERINRRGRRGAQRGDEESEPPMTPMAADKREGKFSLSAAIGVIGG
jgi:hypothetical protein